jgi:hypothetical protein
MVVICYLSSTVYILSLTCQPQQRLERRANPRRSHPSSRAPPSSSVWSLDSPSSPSLLVVSLLSLTSELVLFFLAWRLLNRPVLLVGGGVVATGRLYYLLEAGAKVTIISPREGLTEEVRYRIEDEKLVEKWEDREWEDNDADTLRGQPQRGSPVQLTILLTALLSFTSAQQITTWSSPLSTTSPSPVTSVPFAETSEYR